MSDPVKQARNTKWKPGQSGNPNGRPRKEECITDELRKQLDPAAFAAMLIHHAMKGDSAAFKEIYRRVEGEVSQRLETPDINFAEALHQLADHYANGNGARPA